ncbi:hypothetical protein COHA_002837 [Chlorella ohadii]|uniref:J domain-containing protein n=1 Tax=Chlorella ohadii TaxID=2649997 RepID=A0AAD5DT88_9CHLO|nr:hypothetical protein COHA_002837 [Chlorella ohadii]
MPASVAAMPAAPAPEGAGAAAFEPMQENHQQHAQQPAAAPQQGVFAPKQPAAGSPTAFTAAGTAARRPPGSRRKAAHPARSSTGMGTRSRQSSQEHEAAPPLAPTGPAAPVPLAGAPVQAEAAAGPAAGSGELDAQAKKAYSSSEMYRSQGNEAFRDSNYTAAYDLYTKALHALWPYPALHARLALLLSNRAAALLSQGKPLSALADCQMGLKYDPGLMRCALRVATCHSRMGNFDEAFQFVANLRSTAAGNAEQLREIEPKQRDLEEQERQLYEALRSLGHNLSAPRRDPATGAEAEPLSRAPSGASMHRAASGGANMSRASSAASVAGSAAPQAPASAEAFWEALKKVDDIAPHVPHSELLLAAKAEGLLRLGKHERAREFCGQAVHLDDGAHREAQKRAPWRLWVQAQCSWQEGDARGGLKGQLQALLAALEAQQAQQAQQASASGSGGAAAAAGAGSAFFPAPASAGASTSVAARQEARRAEQLAVIVGLPSCEEVRSLLEGLEAADKLRLAGNAAVKAGKAAEAVAKYSEALQASGLSPAIMAVLLSNRAAAHQHLKQRAQAIADCCRAIALNPHYAKAQSRLATLLSELGYHSDAASALEAAAAAPGIPAADRKEYQSRMASEQAAAKRASSRRGLGGSQAALDHYKLLGLERSVTSDEVRRAYKKLALQLHPDKAASAVRLAPRCAGCGSAPFEALAAQGRLQERATWLFKLLGEASDVLSDASKRRELDHALRAAAGGSGFGSRGGFSSYYGDSDDDVSDIYNSFNNMFGGRRPAGGSGSRAGSYGSGYPGTGAGFGSYGAYGAYGQRGGSSGSGARNWGFF